MICTWKIELKLIRAPCLRVIMNWHLVVYAIRIKDVHNCTTVVQAIQAQLFHKYLDNSNEETYSVQKELFQKLPNLNACSL